ncbi:WG repeat-containing protein [Candidatus Poribacteria bacterium]|nr:WG repeat-containing protein [Candidatus Poribacteria bacterium]
MMKAKIFPTTLFLILSILGLGQISCSQSSSLLFPINQNGRWGYLDEQKRTAINPQFEYAGFFHDGLARVKIGGKYGYIDKSGKYAINPQFDGAHFFHDGLAGVKVGK